MQRLLNFPAQSPRLITQEPDMLANSALTLRPASSHKLAPQGPRALAPPLPENQIQHIRLALAPLALTLSKAPRFRLNPKCIKLNEKCMRIHTHSCLLHDSKSLCHTTCARETAQTQLSNGVTSMCNSIINV